MYVPVRVKFFFTWFVSLSWVAFSVWLSLPWLYQLAEYVSFFPALLIVSLIAYFPGYMNSFLFVGYLIDNRPQPRPLAVYPNISVLIPAYNEEDNIKDTINSVVNQKYKAKIEIIVIDDGSTDKTLEIIKAMNVDSLLLLQNQHGGKAVALNTGMAHSANDLIISIDADTYLRSNAIEKLVEQFVHDPPSTVAVAGSVYVKNSRVNLITKMQEWDYFHAIAAIKRMQSLFQGTLVAQGCFSIYKKAAVQEVNGWPSVVGEDIVLTWSLLRKGYRTGFSEHAICFTNVPTTYRQFFHQRSRWARGLIEAFKAHPGILVMFRLITVLIYWNLMFPLIDSALLFIFIPGVIAAFFGYFFVAGPMTLAVLPITFAYNLVFFFGQRRVFHEENLRVRRNIIGIILYMLIYQLLMLPACIHGYFTELFRGEKRWGTK